MSNQIVHYNYTKRITMLILYIVYIVYVYIFWCHDKPLHICREKRPTNDTRVHTDTYTQINRHAPQIQQHTNTMRPFRVQWTLYGVRFSMQCSQLYSLNLLDLIHFSFSTLFLPFIYTSTLSSIYLLLYCKLTYCVRPIRIGKERYCRRHRFVVVP